MCSKAVDVFVPALKFIPEWFVASKMIKEIVNDNDIFFSDEMGFLRVGVNKINLEAVNFDEADPKTIIHFRLMAWYNRYKQYKVF